MDGKERMKVWNSLPTPKVDWETFKRLVGQLGAEKGIAKAKLIADKVHKNLSTQERNESLRIS